jgi:YD repeat-containing protein
VVEFKAPAGRGNNEGLDDPTPPQNGFDVTEFDYDDFGNLEKITYADGTFEHWLYDAAKHNQVTQYTDRNGVVTTFTLYDNGNIQTITVDPGGLGLTTSYTYVAAPASIDDRLSAGTQMRPGGAE